jgi:hypothetical protein
VWDEVLWAIKAVKGKGLLKALKMFSVPRATLKDYMNNRCKEAEALVTMGMGRKLYFLFKLQIF